jgi:FtsH-binding integral membrane protein
MKQKLAMSADEDADWINAPRNVERQIAKWAAGGWLACVVIALVMVMTEQLEQRLAIRALTVEMVCMSVGSFFLWRRSEKGSFSGGFSSVLGVVSLLGSLVGVARCG